MDEMGIQMMFAASPQAEAEGHVERAAGIFQDRPVTEPRLAGVSSFGRPMACGSGSSLDSTRASVFPAMA